MCALDNSITFQKSGTGDLFEFSVCDSTHPLIKNSSAHLNKTVFGIRRNDNLNSCWRFITACSGSEEYLRVYWNNTYLCYFKNCDDDVNLLNKTITHNAPITENIDNYKIGYPVFMSGEVYNLIDGKYINETDSVDCIPSVKSTGTYKEFLGIIVNKHKTGEKVTIGNVIKTDVIINQDTIDFATHGDFYFSVNDSSIYSIGDTILYDGTIVDDELPITNKIIKSTIGSVTGIINEKCISIFKS